MVIKAIQRFFYIVDGTVGLTGTSHRLSRHRVLSFFLTDHKFIIVDHVVGSKF